MIDRVLRLSGVLGAPVVLVSACACVAQEAPSFQSARQSLRSGEYDTAVEGFRRLADTDPSSASEARRGLFDALMQTGRYEEAERVAAQHDSDAELATRLGRVLRLRGRLAEAEAAYARAIDERASDRWTAELELAILEFDRGNLDLAYSGFDRFIDYYNQARTLDAEQLTAVGTAVAFLGKRRYELFHDSRKAYDEALAKDPGRHSTRVLLGQLFLDKYDSGEAKTIFTEVLSQNPKHAGALLGIAKAMSFDGSAGAMENVTESLDVNPNSVPARVFLAQLKLELEDHEGAKEEAVRALEVNPGSLDALSVRATVARLENDSDAFAALERQILQINPAYAELYNTVAELSAQQRLYADAARFAERALALDAESWRAHGLLGLNLLRTGRIEEGRASLEAGFAGDPFNIWFKNTLDLLDTFENYRIFPTANFEIVLHEREAELLAPYVADVAERALEALRERYGYTPPTPIRLEVFPSHADFSVRTVGLAGIGALGVSFGSVLAMDSPSARDEGDFNWASTLWHEVAHSFHLGLSEHRVPRWFTEGLATYEQRRAQPGWGHTVSPGYLIAYREGQMRPVSQMNDGFVRPRFPEEVVYSYFQASLVTELIEQREGLRGLMAFLEGFAQGKRTNELIRSVLGVEPEEFDEEFDTYVRDRYRTALESTVARPSSQGPGRLETMSSENPNDFFQQLRRGIELFGEGRADEARPFLERANELFPRYGGPDSPLWYLAQIDEEAGDLSGAAERLQMLNGLNESHLSGIERLADLRQRLGQPREEIRALDRLIQVAPARVAAHVRLAELLEEDGDTAGHVRERGALVALGPVDMAEALYQLARARLADGDPAGARTAVLEALEIAPGFEAALELLLELRERAGADR